MPERSNLPNVNESAIIDKISTCVYQAFLDLHQHQPEWLNEKYKKVNWRDAKSQSIFLGRLKEEIDNATDQKVLLLKVRKFLQILLVRSFFEATEFKSLMVKLRQITQQEIVSPSEEISIDKKPTAKSAIPEILTSAEPVAESVAQSNSIAILLLDAENLQLDLETEKFLAGICKYPIQIKVAFANWRSMGKQDLEFHGRSYELIHVPPGKDSADFKMATVGSSIFVHYPTAKEVLVCSSDNGLTHLYNTLQTHGLTVYRVRKQGDFITVLNSKTSEIKKHSLKPLPAIPSLTQSIAQLKDLIKDEQQRTGLQWIKLSKVANLFQTKYNLTISQVVLTHLPGKKSRDIFNEYPTDFVVHQPSSQSPPYVSLFDTPQANKAESKGEEQQEQGEPINNISPTITSSADLEKVLLMLVNELTVNSPEISVYLEVIGTEFSKKYGYSINAIIKDNLKLNGNLLKFLQYSTSFKVEQKKGKWQVAIAQP
ncbi:NYN domain-containing protein [Argonema galeatum]|uniref:NYN domain-containing protein n=1 Tax=Argonema galeatum TaxID=2942762 RepID=UPI00201330E7|nr:NYN domain-containing protein [Argonema galeatum]MCL1463768.1 NYN domain-containing protein [Argonema galeatum A003/A1]